MSSFVDEVKRTDSVSQEAGSSVKDLEIKDKNLLWTDADKEIGALQSHEQEAFKVFKEKCLEEKWTCKELEQGLGNFKLDDQYLLRFLIARDYNVDKAADFLKKHLEWRDEMMPSQITKEDLPNLYNQGVYRYLCKSKQGCNVVLSQSVFSQPSKYSLEEFNKYVVYICEESIRLMDGKGSSQHIWIFDLKGWTLMKDGGMKATKMTQALIGIAQDHYPERLLKSVIVNSPWVFSGFWKIIYPFIDSKTRAKVEFGPPSLLLDYCHAKDLPECYGGSRTDPLPLHPGEVSEEDAETNK
mmetsp:Transcript_11742/g.19145  ORF Transcript_11742/g.19145 Transcript_11742/m.19145 type:complete len:298 (-) Transcript_11742:77-970(-)